MAAAAGGGVAARLRKEDLPLLLRLKKTTGAAESAVGASIVLEDMAELELICSSSI